MEAESELFTTAVDQLLAAWNDPNPAKRRERIDAVWGPASVFADPGVTVIGVDALFKYLDQLRETDPGYRIRRTSRIFIDHGSCAFTWRGDTSGGLRLQGIAHVVVSAEGRITLLRRAMTRPERVASLEGRHPDEA
jgi:hypothetical protein